MNTSIKLAKGTHMPSDIMLPHSFGMCKFVFTHIAPDTTICFAWFGEQKKPLRGAFKDTARSTMPRWNRRKKALAHAIRYWDRNLRTEFWKQLFEATKEATGRDWMI